VLREPHATGGKRIQIWSLDDLLAVGAEFSVAEVVGEDVDYVGRGSSFCFPGAAAGCKEEDYGAELEEFHAPKHTKISATPA